MEYLTKRELTEYKSIDCPRCVFVISIDRDEWIAKHFTGSMYTCPRCAMLFGD